MEEKELKTSVKTRVFIAVIAILMVGSFIASYIAIVLSNNEGSSETSRQIDQAKLAELQQNYQQEQTEFSETEVVKSDFEKFSPFLSEVTAYNEASANGDGLKMQDLVVGEGKELTDGDTDYLAYYVGWCADESVFDSSFDDTKNPTKLKGALDPSNGLIEGWNLGVVGMKLGGIRELTIPGELAYKDTQEICGGTYKPLKFMVMTVENEGERKAAMDELEHALMRYQYYAGYGVDYDELMQSIEAEGSTGEGGE